MLIKQYTTTQRGVDELKKILDELQEKYGESVYEIRQLKYWIEDLEREAM